MVHLNLAKIKISATRHTKIIRFSFNEVMNLVIASNKRKKKVKAFYLVDIIVR